MKVGREERNQTCMEKGRNVKEWRKMKKGKRKGSGSVING